MQPLALSACDRQYGVASVHAACEAMVGLLQGRDVTHDDVKDAILQLTVTEHYYTGVQDLVTLLCEFNDISVKVLILKCTSVGL